MKTIRLENIRALSVNACFQGRRFKTMAYKDYEQEVCALLPKRYPIPEGALRLSLIFGFSNRRQDVDGGVKAFVDILQKAYNFDDNRMYEMQLRKVIVKKGGEFIEWGIEGI